jgi:long-subunit fatty acid transport protein
MHSPTTGRKSGPGLTLLLTLLFTALLGSGEVPVGWAQSTQIPVELQETDRFGIGARALGMGNAYVAVSEDVSSLIHNPAGLAQIRRLELAAGLAHDDLEREVEHTSVGVSERANTRFEHLAFAYPVPTYRGSLVLAVGFHRWSDLDTDFFKEGFLFEPTSTTRGLFEGESFLREGTIDAWTAAVGYDLSPNLSVGASIRYLTGKSHEELVTANYRATLDTVTGRIDYDLGSPADPDDRLFEEIVSREADLQGVTGSIGFLAYLESGFRLGAVLDLPAKLDYDGRERFRLEDWEKIDELSSLYFEDDITLPLSLSGGVSWGRSGLLLAGGVRWTDYTQIDYEGRILAPEDPGTGRRESAYRSVVAVHLGAEYQLTELPVRFRGGFFTEPLPYKLIAADTDFLFVPDDNDPETISDQSIIFRDYPRAEIVTDQKFLTLGAGIVLQDALTVDIAYARGWWERSTPTGYENGTDVYPTFATREKVTQNRFFLTTTVHFE